MMNIVSDNDGATVPVWRRDDAAIRAALIAYVRSNCIFHSSPTMRLVNSRGRPQAWLFDLRPLLLDAGSAMAIAKLFWDAADRFWPFQLAAQELAAVPLLGTLLAYGASIGRTTTGVIVRRERKAHGRQRLLEGELSDLPVILVDDIINSGTAAARAIDILADHDASVIAVFTVVDFKADGAAERLAGHDLPSISVFDLREFDLDLPTPETRESSAPLTMQWKFSPQRPSYMHVSRKAAPVLSGDNVIHASEDGWVHALDRRSGEVRWRFQASMRPGKGVWSTPLVIDDALYVGSYDGVVFKLGAGDGRVIWRFDGADWVGSSAAISADRASIYIGLEHSIHGGSGGIACLDAKTGALVWEHRVPAQVHATPLVLPRGGIVCGANDGRVRLFNPAGGQLIWSTVVGDVKSAAALSRDGETLFVGSCDGAVHALDRRTGQHKWRTATLGAVIAPPLVLDESVAVASTDGSAYLLSVTDGTVAKSYWVGGKLFAGIVRDGDDILVGSTNGTLTRLKGSDLSLVSQHQFPERITSEPLVAEYSLFVATFEGVLYRCDVAP